MLVTSAAAAGTVAFGGLAPPAFAEASASAPSPTIRNRSAWNARPPTSTPQTVSGSPTYIVVHHTATENQTDYSLERAYSLSRGIQNWHMDNNGWIDAGQQFTISRGGHIMEGRSGSLLAVDGGYHLVGTHVANYNGVAVGIENEGTYNSVSPTDALWSSLIRTCAWLCYFYDRPTSAIVGHRDLNSTECPGDQLYSLLPTLRSDVADYLSSNNVSLSARDLAGPEIPPYPPVPSGGPSGAHDHGPALGSDDLNAHEG
ncbi:peptidoglycan recognition protein family protein [Nocardiopsis salina]|uniref:peptidoglycan recognition protein family protein n=1 Tax=Nocardiopsis salina TaxID=245836 RepID=UPI000368A413|nr:peptidoglycan recognition family protein [Nocardiopsis salina]